MMILIITVGSKPNSELASLINEYIKRLPNRLQVRWHFIKNAQGSAEISKQQETEQILRIIPTTSKVVLLDESGVQYSSPEISNLIFSRESRDVTFIIGGAYGVTEPLKKRADIIWSLSSLVFPHQLVRVVLAEQLYRAYTISINHPYHHL